jgi:hypothetical protein
MTYRLRLFRPEQLVVATDHETTVGVGRYAAEFPLDDLMETAPDGSAQASVRREVVYRDLAGGERPATAEEEQEVFEALAERMAEVSEQEAPACSRCGNKPAEHEQPVYPVRLTAEGPVYLACWTPEEREDLPRGFEA